MKEYFNFNNVFAVVKLFFKKSGKFQDLKLEEKLFVVLSTLKAVTLSVVRFPNLSAMRLEGNPINEFSLNQRLNQSLKVCYIK